MRLRSAGRVAWGIHATGFTSILHFKSVNFESANTLSKCEIKATLPWVHTNNFAYAKPKMELLNRIHQYSTHSMYLNVMWNNIAA